MFLTILDFFSELVTNITLTIGILGIIFSWFIGFVPFLIPYKIPINVTATLLVIASMFFKGVQYQEEKSQIEMNLLKSRIEVAEIKSNELTAQIEKALEKEISKTQGVTNEIKKDIQRNKKNIDQCELPDAARVLYNRAVNNKIPRRTAGTDGASPVTDAIRPE